jgi:uncharacterized protein (TIGR03067 family)
MLTLFFLLGLGAGDAQDKMDTTELEGTWLLKSSSEPGKTEGRKMVVEGKSVRLYNPNGDVEAAGTLVVRPDKKPKEIDFILERKDEVYTLRGIYVLDGATLKTAHHAVRENSVRPTEFKRGQDIRVYVYERAK